ncbi:acyltransferase family protein [Siphonobacter sp.]|uniref:acyltransferase family protein n=1 Tax=Siphonobacter sp. TaxID=1869184 RepID=UPI003B3B544A
MSVTTTFPKGRLLSMDAYRGFVMFLMMAEVLQLSQVAENFPESTFWQFLAYHQSHAEWLGCSLHDLIQPSFSFLVGVALPYSLASRISKSEPFWLQFAHTLRRSLILILLGIFLRSIGHSQTNFTFEDTLTQIGLGYPFLFLIAQRSLRTGWIALAMILVGYWLAFVLYPVPAIAPERVGVPADWPYHFTGIAAHFNKNTNLAWAFDTWFLNLFPREKPFLYNGGGYATLSFIPTLGTMVLGLQAGRWIRAQSAGLLKRFLIMGVAGLVLGSLLSVTGLCPSVKRIWTPSWVLFSGGWCFLLLALFYFLIDIQKWQRWSFPLLVIGVNSIAAYCIAHLFEHFIADSFRTHFGPNVYQFLGEPYAPLLRGLIVLLCYWLILYWMYQKKLFIRI